MDKRNISGGGTWCYMCSNELCKTPIKCLEKQKMIMISNSWTFFLGQYQGLMEEQYKKVVELVKEHRERLLRDLRGLKNE